MEHIDNQVNNDDLVHAGEKYYPISKTNQYFQYVRIRSTGIGQCNYHTILITYIEFFGEILSESE